MENLRKELSAKHQSEMEGLQNQFQKELSEQRAELEKIFQAKQEAEGEPLITASMSAGLSVCCDARVNTLAVGLAFPTLAFQRKLLRTYEVASTQEVLRLLATAQPLFHRSLLHIQSLSYY